MTMHDASSKFDCFPVPDDPCAGEIRSPKMVIHLSLEPRQTVSWRVTARSEIRAQGSRVWMTRVFSPYDYWLQAGDVIRVTRGERIWLSADDDGPAEVTVTSEYVERRRRYGFGPVRWLERVFSFLAPIAR